MLRCLGDRFEDDRFQIGGNRRPDAARETRFLLGNSAEEIGSDFPIEGRLQCDCFVEGDSEGVDVGSLIEQIGISVSLFGAHVADASEHLAGQGQAGIGGQKTRQAEVGHPELARAVQKEV